MKQNDTFRDFEAEFLLDICLTLKCQMSISTRRNLGQQRIKGGEAPNTGSGAEQKITRGLRRKSAGVWWQSPHTFFS